MSQIPDHPSPKQRSRAHSGISHRAQRRQEEARRRLRRRLSYAAVAVVAAGLVTLAVVLPNPGTGTHEGAMGDARGGPKVGAKAPAFALTDVVSGKQTTLGSFAGQKTLLFFSEGVGCQACMVQAADLEKNKALGDAGIRLVSVTTDAPAALSDAAEQYGIHTPLLSDPTTSMSAAYGMLGHGGMGHPTQDGHAFMLLDAGGRVVWHQGYESMYVKADQLLSDMGIKA